jgi:hypothetical protein
MSHEQLVKEVQDLLDRVARDCLRVIVAEDLDEHRLRRLAKFCFGCMNQKHELPRRVEQYGYRAVSQVLRFVDAACAELTTDVVEDEQGD